MKNNHHLFTKGEIREALIKIYGEPKNDSDHNRLHQEMDWAWKRMPKYKLEEIKHRSIHLPYKWGIEPPKELIKLRKEYANVDKVTSSLQKKINEKEQKATNFMNKNNKRLETARRNHNFCQVLKDSFPEIYKEVVKIYQEKYPNIKRHSSLGSEMK